MSIRKSSTSAPGRRGKLVIAPGGAHTTVQHDPELQSMALRWLEREFDAREASR